MIKGNSRQELVLPQCRDSKDTALVRLYEDDRSQAFKRPYRDKAVRVAASRIVNGRILGLLGCNIVHADPDSSHLLSLLKCSVLICEVCPRRMYCGTGTSETSPALACRRSSCIIV